MSITLSVFQFRHFLFRVYTCANLWVTIPPAPPPATKHQTHSTGAVPLSSQRHPCSNCDASSRCRLPSAIPEATVSAQWSLPESQSFQCKQRQPPRQRGSTSWCRCCRCCTFLRQQHEWRTAAPFVSAQRTHLRRFAFNACATRSKAAASSCTTATSAFVPFTAVPCRYPRSSLSCNSPLQ